MKKTATLLFILVCGCAANTQAKITKTSAATPFPHFANQEPGISAIHINTRLVKKTRYKYSGAAASAQPTDEVLYEYNSDRGSDVDIYDLSDDDVMYDVSYSNTYTPGGIQKKIQREQHYNGLNQVSQLIYRTWKDNIYKDSLYYEYIYNQAFTSIIDHVNLHIYGGGVGNDVLYTNSPDGQGNVVFMYGVNYFIEFSYDNNNRLLTQTDYHGSQSAPVYNEKDSFIYDGMNRVVTMYVLKMNSSWKMDQIWQYDYSATNDLNTITKNIFIGSTLTNNILETFSYVNHNRISDVTEKWNSSSNSYDPISKLSWTYNQNDQPSQLNTYSWINNHWNTTATDYQIVWEYQTYFPTAVYDVNNELNTNLYPIPARQSLNIALSWKKVQPFNVAIADMTGRTISQWNESATPEYHKNVPVDNMPSGNYFVILTGEDGLKWTQKFQVTH